MQIHLRGILKRFGAVIAVDRVDLEVGDGELFTLLGPSGCGKTLLRLIAGFYVPDGGEIWFGDRRVRRSPSVSRRGSARSTSRDSRTAIPDRSQAGARTETITA